MNHKDWEELALSCAVWVAFLLAAFGLYSLLWWATR